MLLHTYCDGGARGNPGPAANGVVVTTPAGEILEEATQILGETTNNRAEYQGMLLALDVAKRCKGKKLICYSDSQLMVNQLNGLYRIKDAMLKGLADKVKLVIQEFESVEFRHVPRENTFIRRADHLLNQALDQAQLYAKPKQTSFPIQGNLFKPRG